MQTPSRQTIVVIPNEQKVEVTYFCTDKKLKDAEKATHIELVIQLDDCHCSKKIFKTLSANSQYVEALVQNTVINAKGHLC